MFDAIIIGAGLAGISAGQYLIENGNDNFLVLESEHKIGGRIGTVEFGETTFSSGPGWIHGKIGNPVYDLVKDLGIQTIKCQYDEDSTFVWDVKEGKDISKKFYERSCYLNDVVENVSNNLKDDVIDSEKSVFDILSSHSQEFSNQNNIDKVVTFITSEIFMGASLKDASAKVEIQMNKICKSDEEVENLRIIDACGLVKVIDFLSSTFKSKIILRCKVKKIIWNCENDTVKVITDDFRVFICKHVIITVQSESLAKGAIIFEPGIPDDKITSWKHVPEVNYCRIFAKFPRKFWPANDWLLYVPENPDVFGELIAWQNCQKQQLCSDDHNILICHYTSGLENGIDLSKDELIQLVSNSMKNMFPDTYCEPDDVLFLSHRNVRGYSGAFAFSKSGIDDDMIKALEKSIGPLHFAGESVCVELLGTMQAAYITGRCAASKTLN